MKSDNTKINLIVERVMHRLLNENVDISFLKTYNEKFKLIQEKYNNFFRSNLSYPLFYNIFIEFNQLKSEFEIDRRKVVFQYSRLSDEEYYDGIMNKTNNEMALMDFVDKVDALDRAFSAADDVLQKLDEIDYELTTF